MMIKSWKKCKKALQEEMSSEEYNAWINPLEFTTNKSPSGSKDPVSYTHLTLPTTPYV